MRYTRKREVTGSLLSDLVFFFVFFLQTFIPNPSVSPSRPPVQRRETPKKPFYFVFREPREVRAWSRRHTHGPDRHTDMNTNKTVASPAVAGPRTKNPVESRRGFIPPGESRGGRIPYKKSR